ncbi:MAG TPA: hypothetical protein VMH35_02815 [Streptosporangiaceae bacterium]|nr:hypothetical protein [Streptosporangiaceae bacterium]
MERAWERWRSAHGLAAEPLPPVSSYVGYSIEEPWGRPRVVFGVAAEDAERLAEFLQDSLDRGEEGGRGRDGGPRAGARAGHAQDGPAGTERGSVLDDVRGRIPVQSWPEFSESREQLNSSGSTGPGTAAKGPGGWPGARPGQAGLRPPGLPNPVPGQAEAVEAAPEDTAAGPGEAADRSQDGPGRRSAAGADLAGADRAGPGSRPDDAEFADDAGYDDEAEHAAWLSGIRDTDDDEYCDTADDIPATASGRSGPPGAAATGDARPGPAESAGPPAGTDPAGSGVPGWPSPAGLSHEPARPASSPGDGEPAAGAPADGPATPKPLRDRADRAHPDGPRDGAPGGGTGQPADDVARRPQDGPKAAVSAPAAPAGAPGRGGLTDTMAAELAGWAAGELPGQASARLAAWASVGGAVARGRAQARPGGGSTATERVS